MIFLQLFWSFFKIGSFTIGGGYAMVPIIEEELVRKKGWMDGAEFVDMLALSQSAPGILAVNISIATGYRIKGLAGAITATLGTVLPSFIIILLIAMFRPAVPRQCGGGARLQGHTSGSGGTHCRSGIQTGQVGTHQPLQCVDSGGGGSADMAARLFPDMGGTHCRYRRLSLWRI